MISMLWDEDKKRMTDLWIYRKSETYGEFGPLIDVKVFRELESYIPDQKKEEGVGSGNTIILLGREEEQRVLANNMKDYITGKRPKLPKRLKLNKDFYL